MLWTEGMIDWKPAGSISAFQASPYASPVSDPTSSVDWSGYVPSGPQVRPWVRYWARTFDFLLFCLLVGATVVAVWPEAAEMNDTFLGIILLLGYNFIEPAFLTTIGTTPFKALLCVRLRKSDGAKLTYLQGLSRIFSVWIRGQGLGIPLVALITGITSYNRLSNDSITWWDREGGFTVTHRNVAWWRWVILIGLFAGFIGLMMTADEV